MKILRPLCPLCNSRCMKQAHWPRHVSKSCKRKRRYMTVEFAVDVALAARHRRQVDLVVYLCPLGDHWHLSSNHSIGRVA